MDQREYRRRAPKPGHFFQNRKNLGQLLFFLINIAINFLLATFLISLLIELSNKYLKKFLNNKDSFKAEDDNQATLMLNTKKRLNEDDLSLSPSSSSFSDGEYKYTFISYNHEELNLILENIDKKNINNYFIENINS